MTWANVAHCHQAWQFVFAWLWCCRHFTICYENKMRRGRGRMFPFGRDIHSTRSWNDWRKVPIEEMANVRPKASVKSAPGLPWGLPLCPCAWCVPMLIARVVLWSVRTDQPLTLRLSRSTFQTQQHEIFLREHNSTARRQQNLLKHPNVENFLR